MKKKKFFQKAADELKAVGGVATYRGVPIATSAGKCTTKTVAEGTIS